MDSCDAPHTRTPRPFASATDVVPKTPVRHRMANGKIGAIMDASLHVVILAAGEGKRMRLTLPKVLQPIAGRPMLRHVLDSARALAPDAVHVVYGHGGEQVRAQFSDADGELGRASCRERGWRD